MIDLTPLDVRKKRGDFRRILRGYDPEEVDTFMDLVAERFEELVRENLTLSEKTEKLESQLEALEGRESAVQEALVSAQKLRAEVKEQSRRDAEVLEQQASREAELLKAETDAEINKRLMEADSLIRERHRALEDLERSRLRFLKNFRGLLEREIDAVEVEESRRPLDETTLELEFRGWMPGGQAEETAVVAEEDVESFAAEEPEAEADVGVEEEPEAEDEPEAEPEEDDDAVAEAEVTSETADEEEPPMVDAGPVFDLDTVLPTELETVLSSLDTEESASTEDVDHETVAVEPEAAGGTEEGVPGGFETQVLEVSAPAGASQPAEKGFRPPDVEARPDVPHDRAEGDEEAEADTSAPPEEPRWLFSLLKKQEEKEERG